MAADPPAAEFLPTRYGRRGTKVLAIIPMAGFALIFLAGVVATSTSWWEKLLLGLAAAGIALVCVRIGRLAVIAKPTELVIKNIRNTHRIPWSQIALISEPGPVPIAVYRDNALARQHGRLLVLLHEGAVISATLYDRRLFRDSPARRVQRTRAVAALDTLRQQRS